METQDLIIREATINDAEGIATVHVRTWRRAYRGIVPDADLDSMSVSKRTERWRDIFREAKSVTWIAEIAGRVRGFASIGPCRDEDMPDETAELWALYVDPDCWRSGVGSRLWTVMAGAVIPVTTEAVTLLVLADNHNARRFYERQGFQADGTSKTVLIGGSDLVEVRYVKHLR